MSKISMSTFDIEPIKLNTKLNNTFVLQLKGKLQTKHASNYISQ